jgi:hypothetical protein
VPEWTGPSDGWTDGQPEGGRAGGRTGRHFSRLDLVWVSSDIAKDARERWVPVTRDLDPVVTGIREHVGADEYVLQAQRFRDPPFITKRQDFRLRPSSSQPCGSWSCEW